MLILPVVAVVVVVGVWWLSRAGELFYISVRDGKALVVRGRVPVSPSLRGAGLASGEDALELGELGGLDDVLVEAGGARGRAQARTVLSEGAALACRRSSLYRARQTSRAEG